MTGTPGQHGTIFITGASSGLGMAMAKEFAALGYDLALAARRLDRLQDLKNTLQADHNITVEIYELDVTCTETVEPCLQTAAADMGGLDMVIANAGIGGSGTIGSLTDNSFDFQKKTIETNVIGAMATIDAAVRLFRQQQKGHVVAMSSVAGFRGMVGGGAYCASKAALTTYMQSLAAELYGTGITTTTLAPGFIATAIVDGRTKLPFMIDLDRGAKILVRRILQKKPFFTVPRKPWMVIARLIRYLPTRVIAKLK